LHQDQADNGQGGQQLDSHHDICKRAHKRYSETKLTLISVFLIGA
jgi:hypothetical protein